MLSRVRTLPARWDGAEADVSYSRERQQSISDARIQDEPIPPNNVALSVVESAAL
jgi:hypothetical protein